MITINIQNKWLCYFFFQKDELNLLINKLQKLGYKDKDINGAVKAISAIDCGFTFTSFRNKISIIGISESSNKGLWYNTLVHELKHVQSHICEYYNIPEQSELAAYLIGYLMQQIIRKHGTKIY